MADGWELALDVIQSGKATAKLEALAHG
jgi:anthranilate phosphoribosyltransferase